MKLTAYETGEKSPAQHIAKPAPSSYEPVANPKSRAPHTIRWPIQSEDEREARQRLVQQGINRAGGKRALSRATGLDETQIGRWVKGRNQLHDAPRDKIVAYLEEASA